MRVGSNFERLAMLDYIKAVCIIFVIVTHLPWSDEQRSFLLFPFYIDQAVPVFMVISGYAYTRSACKRGICSVRDWFSPPSFVPKLSRVLFPYALIWLSLLVIGLLNGLTEPLMGIARFFVGSWGPGSYYVPVLIQLLVLFPFMMRVVKRWKWRGYFLLLVLNIAFEAFFTLFDLPAGLYRLCFFRYIVFVLAGMLLYETKCTVPKRILLPCVFAGFLYLLAVNYFDFSPLIFSPIWKNTAAPDVLWVYPIVLLLIRMKGVSARIAFGKVLGLVGRSTYHIFLVQMAWYFVIGNLFPTDSVFLLALPSLIVCLSIGVLFHWVDERYLQKQTLQKLH